MEQRHTGSTGAGTSPTWDTAPPTSPPPSDRARPAEDHGPDPTPDPTKERQRVLGWGLALIGAGTAWLLTLAGVAIPWEIVLPVALIGIGLLVLAWPRADAGGLIGLGMVVLVIGLVAPGVTGPTSFTAGERTYEVTDPADLDDRYGLGAGELVLDLRDLEAIPPGSVVAARVTFGELTVLVPEDVRVRGDARVAFGEVEHFGRATGGVNPNVALADPAPDGDEVLQDEVLELDLRVAFGRIEVRR